MSGFKGTKGKWVACCMTRKPHYVFNEECNVTICSPVQIQEMSKNLSETEFKANALLISKAPEMLEMLESVVAMFAKGKILHVDKVVEKRGEIEQLIKSCTEL